MLWVVVAFACPVKRAWSGSQAEHLVEQQLAGYQAFTGNGPMCVHSEEEQSMSKLEPDQVCPQCSAKIKRIHRGFTDRVWSILLEIKTRGRFQYSRFECSQCTWTDLLQRRSYK
jgi:hypothetical protein